MAWLDDTVWSHPKFTDVSDRAFRIWIKSIAYSSGFGTRGYLTPGQQETIGTKSANRNELIKARLWDEHPGGTVRIHNWDEHNGKRDERRAKDRERKRQKRLEKHGLPQDSPQDVPADGPRDEDEDIPWDAPQSRRTLGDDRVTDDRTTAVRAAGSNASMNGSNAVGSTGTGLPYTFNLDAEGWPLSAEQAHELAEQLRGHDRSTDKVLISLSRKHPPSAFYHALESLRWRRNQRPKLDNEAAYFVQTVKEVARQ